MPRKSAPRRVHASVNVAFKDGQENLTEVLTRLDGKVNRKEESADVPTVIQRNVNRYVTEIVQQGGGDFDDEHARQDFYEGYGSTVVDAFNDEEHALEDFYDGLGSDVDVVVNTDEAALQEFYEGLNN